MARLDTERQAELEPKRMDYARKMLMNLGLDVEDRGKTTLVFRWKGELITLYPYSGWHSGKTIVDGRGIDKLLKQLK